MGVLRSSQPGLAGTPRRNRLQGWPWEIRLIVLTTIYLGPPLALAVAAALAYFTLPQQLAKSQFMGPQRAHARELEEVLLALWREVRLGKRNILELYLNRVYFGSGAYGVETASQRFFGKSAREVTLVEAAVLAG